MDQLSDLKKRIERLERAVFPSPGVEAQPRQISSRGGPTAGIIVLANSGFFDAPNRKSLRDVMAALVEQGKDYSHQAVHIALQRLSKGKKAILVRHKDGSNNNYVARG